MTDVTGIVGVFAWLLVGTFVLLAVGGGAWLWYKAKNQEKGY